MSVVGMASAVPTDTATPVPHSGAVPDLIYKHNKGEFMLKFNKDELKKMCLALKPDDKLQIVGDHGVYIMPTWKDGRTTKVGVVYAEGCSPTLNPDDFYDNKVNEFGGDDGADIIGNVLEMLKICFASKSHINVHLTPTQIKVSAG